MNLFIQPSECLAEFIVVPDCGPEYYQVYRLLSGTLETPETIMIFWEDKTFRVLYEGEYSIKS